MSATPDNTLAGPEQLIADLQRQLAECRAERDEALQRETATAEVLQVINSSTGNLAPIFDAILEKALRVCSASFGMMSSHDNGRLTNVAARGLPAAYNNWRLEHPLEARSFGYPPTLQQVLAGEAVVHEPDLMAGEAYPGFRALVDLAGARSQVTVALRNNDALHGTIMIFRQEVRPFSDKEIRVLQNFAAQAVIAIENARLLAELRQSLEQQIATADVLRVISSSQGDLAPVFQAMLENASRICGASVGNLLLYDGSQFRVAAMHNPTAAFAAAYRALGSVVPTRPSNPLRRVVNDKKLQHVADARMEQAYSEGDPALTQLVDTAGARTLLAVPMLKENELVGVFGIYRQEVRLFTDKQIALVQNFAAQAVIAIENARLLNELRRRTDDLSEALEQQTAASEVLRVISTSRGELEPVFTAILASATRICRANFGGLFGMENGRLRVLAQLGVSEKFLKAVRSGEHPPGPRNAVSQLFETRLAVHIADYRHHEAYLTRDPMAVIGVELAGIRTLLNVPMIRNGELIGFFGIFRQEVAPFSEKEVALVTNFAAQAVIAIENTRLLNELRESLEQQTATSEVLSVISSSPGELEPVFQAMLENATRICEAEFGTMFLRQGDVFRFAAEVGTPAPLAEFNKQRKALVPTPGSALEQALRTKQVSHVADATAADKPGFSAKLGSTVCVPMLKDEELAGVIFIYRQEVRPFTEKQIDLLQNFAAQAVIAIENTRLLNELRQRTEDLSKSLEDLRTAQDRLVQTQKLASLGQLTAGIAHEIKNPLNFVNNFSGVSVELISELHETLGRVTADDKTRAEIAELADTLRDNLDKIVQHGKRADSIVKNMLLHSRQGSGEHRPVDINALVEESLNLAYHGVRAERQGFNITLERSFDPAAGQIDAFPQEISRVLLNVISNGFYAAAKRREQTGGDGYEATLTVATRNLGDRVEIRIRDNGTGMLPEVREKLFNPFFTTKPAGEGTGLGLSISHDIIVKQHGGSIEVETRPGAFTEFRIVLPRKAA